MASLSSAKEVFKTGHKGPPITHRLSLLLKQADQPKPSYARAGDISRELVIVRDYQVSLLAPFACLGSVQVGSEHICRCGTFLRACPVYLCLGITLRSTLLGSSAQSLSCIDALADWTFSNHQRAEARLINVSLA